MWFCCSQLVKISVTAVKQQPSQTEREPKSEMHLQNRPLRSAETRLTSVQITTSFSEFIFTHIGHMFLQIKPYVVCVFPQYCHPDAAELFLIDLRQQKDADSTFKPLENPSQSCSPETHLCFVILPSK